MQMVLAHLSNVDQHDSDENPCDENTTGASSCQGGTGTDEETCTDTST